MNRAPHFGVYARLAPSKIHGVGVIAIRRIPKGTYVFVGDDEEMTWIRKSSIAKISGPLKKLYRDFCVVRNGNFGCPGNFNQLTLPWYLNHSSKPNLAADKDLRFFSIRDIKCGEELTVDYSTYSGTSSRGLKP